MNKSLPSGMVYKCGNPSFLGVIPVRNDITVLPADSDDGEVIIINSHNKILNKKRVIGFTVTETLGIAVINSRSISKLSKEIK